jgi:ribosomal-protein-serine acetyltransferase
LAGEAEIEKMFTHKVNDQIELRILQLSHAGEFFAVLDQNRDYLRPWHPWVDLLKSEQHVEKAIQLWNKQYEAHRGFHAGIWFEGHFCGVVNHLNVDFTNRWTALSYWLDASHQGRGIMTACCGAMIEHAFETWKLNRVTIECATENIRSRKIPERLGFKLEGTIRQIEWLHDHLADHAFYGLLEEDYVKGKIAENVESDCCRPL